MRGNEEEPCIRRAWWLIIRRQIPAQPLECPSKSSAVRRVTRVNTVLNRGRRRLDHGSHRMRRVFYMKAPAINRLEGHASSCPVRKVTGSSSSRFCFHQPGKIAKSIPILRTWKDPLLFKKVTTKRAPPVF